MGVWMLENTTALHTFILIYEDFRVLMSEGCFLLCGYHGNILSD